MSRISVSLDLVVNVSDETKQFQECNLHLILIYIALFPVDTVQAGFGWTNGVTFWAFDTFEGFVEPNCTISS